MTPMTAHEIQNELESLPGWRVERGWLARDLGFSDFQSSWEFMDRIARLAEEQDHHPNWYNVYNRVEVSLTTHECNGLTKRDTSMALFMEEIAGNSTSSEK